MGDKVWKKVENPTLANGMSNFYFNGSTHSKLDDKNRFVLPQQMRYGLIEKGELHFTLALGIGGSLAIYRRSDIDKIAAQFQAKQHVAQYRKFFTLFFSTLHHTSCDKLGRVLLPPVLKEATGIRQEIVIAGVLNRVEIWPKERYEKDMKIFLEGEDDSLAKMTEEAFTLLDGNEALFTAEDQEVYREF
ncbi:MAG: Transcriptional regulator MraZ [Chlamydiae bacterium]|nr:Transcriptional regulator MraZ [Chlamydiota bacterium]